LVPSPTPSPSLSLSLWCTAGPGCCGIVGVPSPRLCFLFIQSPFVHHACTYRDVLNGVICAYYPSHNTWLVMPDAYYADYVILWPGTWHGPRPNQSLRLLFGFDYLGNIYTYGGIRQVLPRYASHILLMRLTVGACCGRISVEARCCMVRCAMIPEYL
jgi:hypothetical protein